jgi:hypothetical protein
MADVAVQVRVQELERWWRCEGAEHFLESSQLGLSPCQVPTELAGVGCPLGS